MRSSSLLLRAGLTVLLLAGEASAAQYETEIEADSELELYEANQRGDISDGTLETLIELLRTGVDLNRASREELYELPNITYAEVDEILRYRKLVTHIDEPTDLVKVNILTEKQLLQIAPFLVVGERVMGVGPVSGLVRAVGMYTVGDPLAPPSYLQARAKGSFGLSAGLLLVGTRRRLGDVQWDSTRSAFTATEPQYGLEVPKFFLQWKGSQVSVIAGTYRVGFGQRLTIDNTSRNTPDGIYPDDAILSSLRSLSGLCRFSGGIGDDPECTEYEDDLHITPDFKWRNAFRGVTARIRDLEAGSVSLGLTAFASYESRSNYQYSVFNAEQCPDPHDDSDSDCAAPPTYLRRADGTVATTRFSFQTLPALFDEATGGGNASLNLGPGRRVGLTGYYSKPIQKIPQIDFQEWNRYPYGGGFGAVGLDGAFTFDKLSLFGEATRSFDGTPGNGGGFGVVQRSVYSISKQEFELALRYYDPKFVNPYARAISQPDQLDGQRVRNEAGARLRFLGKPLPDFAVRAEVDFWTLPGEGSTPGTAGAKNLRASLRGDFIGWDFFKPGLWLDYRNKGRGAELPGTDFGSTETTCYEVSTSTDSEGDSLTCDGQYFRIIERASLVPIRKYLNLSLQAQQKFVNDARYDPNFRMDISFFAQASSQPLESIRLRVRTKYLDEGVDDDTIGERSVWSFIDLAYILPRRAEVRMRYDHYLWLDQRASSLVRLPNPEHRLRLELEGRF